MLKKLIKNLHALMELETSVLLKVLSNNVVILSVSINYEFLNYLDFPATTRDILKHKNSFHKFNFFNTN